MSDGEEKAPEIRVTCPECGVDLVADGADAGRESVCPDCGKKLTVPDKPAPPDAPAEPPESEPASETKKPKFTLQDEVPLPPPKQADTETDAQSAPAEPPWLPAPRAGASAPAALPEEVPLGHESRAKLTGWMRRVSLVVLAFAIVKTFDAAWAAVRMAPATDLHDIVARAERFFRALPGKVDLLVVRRALETSGSFSPLERFGLALIVMMFLARLVVRLKLMDALYVTATRWAERSHGGITWHALAVFLQAGILAWAASVIKTPTAGEGMAAGLIAAFLLVSAAWLFSLYLISTDEFPGLAPWALADAVFGAAIVLMLLWPRLAVLWTRSGATIVLCMANGVIAAHVGASFIFARRPRGWWWRKPLFLVASCAIVLCIAFILAVVR